MLSIFKAAMIYKKPISILSFFVIECPRNIKMLSKTTKILRDSGIFKLLKQEIYRPLQKIGLKILI